MKSMKLNKTGILGILLFFLKIMWLIISFSIRAARAILWPQPLHKHFHVL